VRTSAASPIYVDFLDAADTGLEGRIGLTIAPGKKDVPLWDRDLDADLTRLRDQYKCDLLVSLMEPHEYEWLGITDLFERASKRGIVTVPFPIEDGSVPAPEEMPGFAELIERILAATRGGETVVIHCRGGLGRSGTVAAACLVALGHPPARAIERVRQARPGAVETPAQEDWVQAFAETRSNSSSPI
jgi:protein-tyrosine phosphatase